MLLGILALADCVTSFLTHERGLDHRHAREVRNKWLYITLGAK